ncbi:hypothetical protein, partial [Bernardetia sp.]|uniref:hypothetical protein n=1 Tax=Bernardetia sp. TaxID=1937974 RepID=UPI0025C05654
NVISTPDRSVHYLKNRGGVVLTKFSKPSPTNPKELRTEENYSDEKVAYWGQNNDFPYRLKEMIKGTIVSSTLYFKMKAMFSRGIEFGYVNEDDEFIRIKDKEIKKWLYRSNINRYALKAISDKIFYNHAYPEFVFSVDKKQIVSLVAQEAEFCRWEKHDSNGFIKNCYIKTNWHEDPAAKDAIKVPVIDIYTYDMEEIKKNTSFKFIYPVFTPTGKKYYQDSYWSALLESGWLDVAKAIPLFKKALMENQITVKYIIKIPEHYWEWKFTADEDGNGGWDSFSSDEKQSKIDEALLEFEDFLTGNENAGKALMMHYKFDANTQEKYPSWEIEPVRSEIKDGEYIQDSQEANSHIFHHLGFPSALGGNAPGKTGQGAGSGSDVREYWNLFSIVNYAEEYEILDPLKFIAEYNGWNDKHGEIIEFRFKKSFLQTKDEVTPKKRENAAE